jgi:hypothetical protein
MNRNLLLGGIAAAMFLLSGLVALASWSSGGTPRRPTPPAATASLSAATSADAKAAAIVGIAREGQYSAMPQLIVAIEDGDPIVAGRALAAVQHLLGVRYEFEPSCLKSPKERAALASMARKDWASLQKFPRFQQSQKSPEALR